MTRELLFSVTREDFDWETFRAGGKGGQHQNKTESAVRCRHRASGAVAECRNHRDQHRNRVEAFKRCIERPEFKAWLQKASAQALLSKSEQATAEQRVEAAMAPGNLLVEVKENGKWTREGGA